MCSSWPCTLSFVVISYLSVCVFCVCFLRAAGCLRKKKLTFFTCVALLNAVRIIRHTSSSKSERFSRDEDFKLDYSSLESRIIQITVLKLL